MNQDDFDYVASQIITCTKNSSSDDNSDDDNLALITKIREDLGDSSTNILPFIESCKRNGDSIRDIRIFSVPHYLW